jgi:hypothetical protein
MDITYGITNTEYCSHGSHFVKAENITWIVTKNGRRRICETCKENSQQATRKLRKK